MQTVTIKTTEHVRLIGFLYPSYFDFRPHVEWRDLIIWRSDARHYGAYGVVVQLGWENMKLVYSRLKDDSHAPVQRTRRDGVTGFFTFDVQVVDNLDLFVAQELAELNK